MPSPLVYTNLQKSTTQIKLIFLIETMTDKEKIISAIATIDSMLTLDFMTDPVRADLNNIKILLVAVRDNLS